MNKKIVHIADFSSLGGVQSYLLSLAKFSKIFILFSTSEILDIYKSKNLSILRFSLFPFKNKLKNKVCIIHNLILSKMWPIYYLLNRIKGNKIYYHEHGAAWHNPDKNKFLYTKRINKVDLIIVNSFATKRLLKKIYKINKKIFVLKSPINLYDESNLVPKEISYKKTKISNFNLSRKILIGYMGRLEIHKNPLFLIRLASALKDRYNLSVSVEFVGSGSLENYLKQKSSDLDIECKFWGRIPTRRPVVENWDFCIVPSIREPLGLVPGEMALMDTLTLASKVDGLPELYPKSCNELLIDMKKESEIDNSNQQISFQYCHENLNFTKGYVPSLEKCIKRIYSILNDEIKYKNLLESHKEFIIKNFNIQNHVNQLIEIVSSESM